jgi:magnesium chelatase family protein
MAATTLLSRAQDGMTAPLVRVEVDVGNGLPTFAIAGLAETVVRESKHRVRSAIENNEFEFPAGRITVNLSPADLPKEGGRFDLPIALGLLHASKQLPELHLEDCELYGELSLNGEVRPVRGALLAALAATGAAHSIVIPQANASEAAIVSGSRYAVVNQLRDLANHARELERLCFQSGRSPASGIVRVVDLCDVKGQAHAKRALEIAAAGQHSLLMIGPPGTGKSMLAQRLPGLLPAMSEAEALEVAAVRSVAGLPIKPAEWRVRPYRNPHHSASSVALVGGGSSPRPGEASLAHHGVLFLDELPEFDRRVLESLREPIESGSIVVSRAARQAEFPAGFQFVAAMNPCPCGYLGDARCRCTSEQVDRYRAKLSGPLLDRIDLHIEVPRVHPDILKSKTDDAESSATVAERVFRARDRQIARQSVANSRLNNREVERHCRPTPAAIALLDRASNALGLSARAYHRVIKVARTIADLAGVDEIDATHMGEALALRRLDRRLSSNTGTTSTYLPCSRPRS